MSEVDDFDDEDVATPIKAGKAATATPVARPKTSLSTKFEASSGYKPAGDAPRPAKAKPADKAKSFATENEERYSWLVEVKDADGHGVDDAEYDPRTLFIPPAAWHKFTAFEKQYWEVKSKMWDTVVFFKKGKFYELYERDADIAHSEFDLKLAGGGRANMRLCGVPEMSFDYWASSFIAKGHKVAKVDQMETLLGKEMREKGKKEEKIIRRELKCVLTGGTLVDESMLVDEMSTYCMAIKEGRTAAGLPVFGVCFVDTATGSFHLAEFEDDVDFTQFQTTVAQVRPKELLLEKGIVTKPVVRIIKNNTSTSTLWNYLKPYDEFWDEEVTRDELARGGYFAETDPAKWPPALAAALAKPLALAALGGLLWYLKFLKVDKELLSLGNIHAYDPIRETTSLVLDGQSLVNLEIFANSYDGSDEGTLFKLLNRCISPFGKRLLRKWLCHPLQDTAKIRARLDVVDRINSDYDLQALLERGLASLPDLERLVSRIHAGKCKVKDFVRVIESFEQIYEIIVQLQTGFELDGLIGELIAGVPPLDECLPMWRDAFDRAKAKADGVLVPAKGVEQDFDASHEAIAALEGQLADVLRGYRRQYKCQDICFKDSGKEIYLIELPVRVAKDVPASWQQMSATQKSKRYWSPEVRGLVRELLEARERHKTIAEEMQFRLYMKFDRLYDHWIRVIGLVANLDCLLSLARTSAALGTPSCRPEFVGGDRSTLEFRDLRHPCFAGTDDFIPNDVCLGGSRANVTLLTGANAAGKSTVLRMSCVAVIMAQIGCYVPAESARMTPVDRIMTRLGANDNIFAGQSTFYVELSETKKMLSQATSRSLVVLDELGRGGSSSDGFAIAEAVLYHIATHIGSLGFFATHYGTLASSFEGHPEVEPKRMAILVDEDDRKVTFLYKLEDGVSPGSFGMHVAAMCGIDAKIIDNAETAARDYEHTSQVKKHMETTRDGQFVPLGLQSDFRWLMALANGEPVDEFNRPFGVETILKAVGGL
ncbi:muts domain V-domain-containing protein [Dipodascopsis tothii]|uniref:muts domain V-domain-containing protein n=1 Tax=Dipodascopsis tothii TaxID=44089 RepID=UPI0034CE9A4B